MIRKKIAEASTAQKPNERVWKQKERENEGGEVVCVGMIRSMGSRHKESESWPTCFALSIQGK